VADPAVEPGALRVALVLATSTGGVGHHVRSLAEGLVQRGVQVCVIGPAATEELFAFTGTGAAFEPVDIAAGPRPAADAAAVRRLRRLFAALRTGESLLAGAEITGPSRVGEIPSRLVVHAHGLRAGLLAGLALGRRAPGRTPLVVTWHNAVLGGGPKRALLAWMERAVARRADVTLGASSDLVDRARALGAVDARLGPVAAPPLAVPTRTRDEARAALGAELGLGLGPGSGRPLVLAVGRLAPQKGYGVLLDAARGWTELAPPPLALVAGDGPLGPDLQSRIDAESLPVRLLGHRSDVPDLLQACDLVVLPSVWEARALVAQEALRAGRPLVATAVGGIPELVGDAAVLVGPGDADALRDAVARLAADPAERARLAALGLEQAASWPDEADTIAQALAVYQEWVP